MPTNQAANQVIDPLIDIKAVSAAVGLRRSAIYKRVAAQRFPSPVRLSAKATRWRLSDVQTWLSQQTSEVPV